MELSREEVMVESLVLSSLFKDLTLVEDSNVNADMFESSKVKFYYELLEQMVKEREYKELTKVAIDSFLKDKNKTRETYESYGAYDSIENLQKLTKSSSNFDQFLDDLMKQNLIRKLDELGFNTRKKITFEGQEIRIKDILPAMSSQQVYEFYESLLADASNKVENTDMVIEDIWYTDEEIEKIKNGDIDQSASYGTFYYTDENGRECSKHNLQLLDSITDGMHESAVYLLGASSGVGKSTMAWNQAINLVSGGEKLLYISNEQSSGYFKQLLTSMIASNVFGCYSLTRRKIAKMEFNNEELKIFKKTNNYIKEHFKDNLKFLQVTEFNIDRILKMAKKMRLTYDFKCLFIETFKASNAEDNNSVGEMVAMSRKLHEFAMKTKSIVFLDQQLMAANAGKVSILSEAQLSASKQVVEVVSQLILMRKVVPAELDKDDKRYFLKPFRWEKDSNGKYFKNYLEFYDSKTEQVESRRRRPHGNNSNKYKLDINAQYRLAFVTKNRNGESDQVLLIKMNGITGFMETVGFCDNVYTGQLTY